MHQFVKLTPLLLGAVSLSACSALGFGEPHSHASNGLQSGQYTQVASNTHTNTSNTHTNTMSDYNASNGWYASGTNPYAGGNVQLDTLPNNASASTAYTKMAHTGYHDAHGNPVPAPVGSYHTNSHAGTHSGRVDTTYVRPALRGSYGPSYYGNIGGIMYDVDDDLFGVIGRLGVQKNWYGAEVEGSFGVIDDDIDDELSAGIDHTLAAFAVGRVPLGNRVKALGRVGYHTTQLGIMSEQDDATISISEDFDGIAYGAGLEYDIDRVNGLRLDYTRYELTEDATSDSISATYLRRF